MVGVMVEVSRGPPRTGTNILMGFCGSAGIRWAFPFSVLIEEGAMDARGLPGRVTQEEN
jgi:hypothetical protein